ncbi:helix-turn-helix domain-containing protein [Brevibacillus humidisoli]|uniref:PucR family transcriptional regulator n=1 Tax=Brevibacillus humidisoli TaxID=2895522 RepID=UPI001E5804AB|nr:helix-turn-helix domain-containing protein [Brevibacillus humidisoli]UFJ43094.1 helix-turn-helix domain-containing protein [Brevibacillus humidisoli]
MEIWQREVARIRSTTKLTIGLFSCCEAEWPEQKRRYEQADKEIVCYRRESGQIWYVGIPRKEWPPSARALLSLLLSPEQPGASSDQTDAYRDWLRSCFQTGTVDRTTAIEPPWQWYEARACFLLERQRAEAPADLSYWLQLLNDFVSSSEQKVTLFPLDHRDLLLLVPISLFPEVEKNGQSDSQLWLDWAAGLHELLSSEAGETVRVLVTVPAVRPQLLPETMQRFSRLRHAINRFLPRITVAATWQHSLEQWAASLDPSLTEALASSLQSLVYSHQLSEDQWEMIETFCRHNLNTSEAARALFLHRNTLLYRLDKLAEVTKLDLRHFPDALLLLLAAMFRQND